jgi:serine/threonine protein kinase
MGSFMASSESSFEFLDAPTEPGDVGSLGHYRVIEELGRGGMGFVFRARDKRLHRDVALKVMNQKVAGTPFSRRRFIHEARAMAAVHHDNVATIFEVGEKAGTPFMAMEMLKGATLEEFNDGQQCLGYEQVIRYADQIAQGLAAAHAQGIVHRDIKPANIWIQPDKDRVKILDFGLALAATPVDQLAGRGAVIGTPGYLSPEQARTEPLDDRSDLYSLGVVLYEMCTGCLPLHSSSVPGQLIAILAHRPRPLREINPEIPEPLADLIHRLLYKEPRARIASASVLVEELKRVETACHEKSEVAQTINKLQQGLSEVVGKRSSSFDITSDPDVEVLDPFAALPDATPTAPANASQTTLPPTPAAAMAGKPVGTAAYSHPRLPIQKPAPSVWQKYLPLAIVGAAALLVLPLLAYYFTRGSRSTEPIVIAQSVDSGGGDSASSPARPNRDSGQRAVQVEKKPVTSESSAAAGGQAAKTNQRRNQNSGAAGGNNASGRGANAKNNAKTGQARPGDGGNQPRAGTAASANAAKRNRNGAANNAASTNNAAGQPAAGAGGNGNRKPAEVVLAANNAKLTPDVNAATTANNRVLPAEPAEATPVEMKTVRIATSDGRGADATVQIGTTAKMGTKPSIAIHRRGKIESHHSYIRFDLAAIEDVKSELESAELMLTLVASNRPSGATIRLHGMPDAVSTLWNEEGPRALVWLNTPSSVQLDTLPLLATVQLGGPSDSQEPGSKTVRISTPEFTQFIREAKEDTITLVIAGSSGGRAPLRFVSREGSPHRAPALLIVAPKNPTPGKGNQRRGAGQR